MNDDAKWEVVMNGHVFDEHFSTENEANTFAGRERQKTRRALSERGINATSDERVKIVIYEIDSVRHQKAFNLRLTPHRPSVLDPALGVRP